MHFEPQQATNSSVQGYRFAPAHLRVRDRKPGISAFMRIRNGEDFLEATIRSHINYFDEIVAVHNRCTDATPEILANLQREFGEESLRVIHYADPVYPPGSEGHIHTEPNSPHSLVNYYNFALVATRRQWATKLDDDHLAIADATEAITSSIRSGEVDPHAMHCFSGLNLMRGPDGQLGVPASSPLSGSGDIGFFRVTPQTCFSHDRRFERFERGGAKRRFAGFLYWHLKFMKQKMGFANYDLSENPDSRYSRRKAKLERSPPPLWSPRELAQKARPGVLDRLLALVSDKKATTLMRNATIGVAMPDDSVEDALRRTVAASMHSCEGLQELFAGDPPTSFRIYHGGSARQSA